jgi:hypothetical protein
MSRFWDSIKSKIILSDRPQAERILIHKRIAAVGGIISVTESAGLAVNAISNVGLTPAIQNGFSFVLQNGLVSELHSHPVMWVPVVVAGASAFATILGLAGWHDVRVEIKKARKEAWRQSLPMERVEEPVKPRFTGNTQLEEMPRT